MSNFDFLKGNNILDLGCGTGRDSKYFIDKGYLSIQVLFIRGGKIVERHSKILSWSCMFTFISITIICCNLQIY